MSKRTVLTLGMVIGLTLVGLWQPESPVWSMGSRVPAVGMLVEDFRLTDLAGHTQSLSQYRGKIVLINFWATWCKPCTTEMPAMQTTYDKLHDKGFVVLAVNELEDELKVREHIVQYGHTFPVLLDKDNRVANQFGVFGLPVSVFIDENGIVQEYIKGGLLTEQKIVEVVARIQRQQPIRSSSLLGPEMDGGRTV
jgi:peroxiredoxin